MRSILLVNAAAVAEGSDGRESPAGPALSLISDVSDAVRVLGGPVPGGGGVTNIADALDVLGELLGVHEHSLQLLNALALEVGWDGRGPGHVWDILQDVQVLGEREDCGKGEYN